MHSSSGRRSDNHGSSPNCRVPHISLLDGAWRWPTHRTILGAPFMTVSSSWVGSEVPFLFMGERPGKTHLSRTIEARIRWSSLGNSRSAATNLKPDCAGLVKYVCACALSQHDRKALRAGTKPLRRHHRSGRPQAEPRWRSPPATHPDALPRTAPRRNHPCLLRITETRMTSEGYDAFEDPYCYPGTPVLINRLDIRRVAHP